jgi:murein DD-endopeptidase MepM/ murein hydrolase activator NlpD
MRKEILAIAASVSLGACHDPHAATSSVMRVYAAPSAPSPIERRLLIQAWLDAARFALAQPTQVELPYAEWGGFLHSKPSARALSFTASEGQIVKVGLINPSQDGSDVGGAVRTELFFVEERSSQPTELRVAEMPAGETALWFRLPERGRYVVRLQPEPLVDSLYRLSVELEAALPFPVRGRSYDAILSPFGAPRDFGQRRHEGVDIFAPRLTPVVAVADGRATPRENRLGGNTVWLSTPGTSYYYAHLERAAVKDGQRVRAGDVLGYVGNSGNASTTDPHLHFGIYRWGRGAIDPLPLLEQHVFATPDEPGSADLALAFGAGCGEAKSVHVVASRVAAPSAPRCRPADLRADGTRDCDEIDSAGATRLALPRAIEWDVAEPYPIDVEQPASPIEFSDSFEIAPIDALRGPMIEPPLSAGACRGSAGDFGLAGVVPADPSGARTIAF